MEFTTKTIRKADQFGGQWVDISIQLPDSERTVTVTVMGPDARYGGSVQQPPAVNWPSIGASTPADAEAFGLLLVRASVVAPTLAGPTTVEDQ